MNPFDDTRPKDSIYQPVLVAVIKPSNKLHYDSPYRYLLDI